MPAGATGRPDRPLHPRRQKGVTPIPSDDGNERTAPSIRPVVVLDLWEDAFMVDYRPAQKGHYIEAFFSRVDWSGCEKRLGRPILS